MANAPVLIVSTYERGKSGFFRGQATNEIGDGWGAIRECLEIPDNEAIMAVIALGYRAQEPQRPQRRPLEDVVRFF